MFEGLPDERGRVQIFEIYVSQMRESGRLDKGVVVKELAAETKNYSGAEIAGLVRAAQSMAMNRVITVSVLLFLHSLSLLFRNIQTNKFIFQTSFII